MALLAQHRAAPPAPQPRGTPRLAQPAEPAAADQFVEVSESAGIRFALTSGGPEKHYIIEAKGGGGIAWTDYDGDGFPDLFLVNGSTFEQWRRGSSPRSRLFHNRGDGTFTDVSAGSGLDHTGWGMGVCAGDYDNDGRDDLYVTYYGGNVLYRNEGGGKFSDQTQRAGVRGHGWSMGCAFGDYDNDGYLDLYVANYVDVDIEHLGEPGSAPNCTYRGVATFCGPRGLAGGRDILYHNNRDGTFTDVTYLAGLGDVGWLFTTFGAKFLDYDNDGWKDIVLANGQTFPQIDRFQTGITYAERNLLFHNRGDGKFDEVGRQSGPGFEIRKVSRGLATADYDNDGDLEILVSNMSSSPDLLRRLRKNPNHSILVRTIGTKSNRDGIGAEVKVTAGDLTQYDTVRSGGSYLSASDLRLHFGLGKRTAIDRIDVRWPSGQTQTLENPPIDHILVIKEGAGLVSSEPFRKAPGPAQ